MKFALDKLLTEGRAISLINMAVVISLAWSASGMVNVWISKKLTSVERFAPPKIDKKTLPQKRASYSVIKDRNIFNPAAVREAPPAPEEIAAEAVAAEGEYVPTSLNLSLMGTVIADDPSNNAAVIKDPQRREQELYHVYDSVAPQAVIVRVERFRVLIDNHGKMESLSINLENRLRPGNKKRGKKKPGISTSRLNGAVRKIGEGQVVVDRRYLGDQLKNMNKLMVDIRAVPNTTPEGQMKGFKVFQIKKGSIYDKIGLKDKDIIERVNGQSLDSAQKGLDLFMALKNESHFTIDLVRNKTKQTMNIEVQ